MGLVELMLMGVGLAMDAFAVSICKGSCHAQGQQKAMFCHCAFLWRISGVDAIFGMALGKSVRR